MSRLKEISDGFVDSLSGLKSKFELTSDTNFVKYGAAALLAMSMSTGAFANQDMIPIMEEGGLTHTLVQELKSEVSDHTLKLTDNRLKDIVNGQTGAFTHPEDDVLIIISNDFSTDYLPAKADNIIRDIYDAENKGHKKSPFAHHLIEEGFFSNSSDVRMVNMVDDYYDNDSRMSEFPKLLEHQNTFIFGHELAHVYGKKQLDIINDFESNHFSPILKMETMSDIVGIMFTAKMKNLSLDETNELIDDVVGYRDMNMKNGDIVHATGYALKEFKNIINEDIESFGKLKSANFMKMDEVLSDVGEELFSSIENKFEEKYDNKFMAGKKKMRAEIETLSEYSAPEDVKDDVRSTLKFK